MVWGLLYPGRVYFRGPGGVRVRLGGAVRARLTTLAVVLAVAAGLLAMHQLSIGHAAVVPTELGVRAAAGHPAPGVAAGDHGPVAAVDHDHRPGQDVRGCAGCGDHGLEMIGCLAVVLLIMSWLLRPHHRPRSRPALPQPLSQTVNSILLDWRRPPISLLELEIRRT